MLKYSDGCKRDLEIDNFCFHKKSTSEECVNKKVKCDYYDKEINSTNLSKHIKQIHSTYNTSRTSDSNSNSSRKNDNTTNRSTNNDSTSNSRSEQIDDSSYSNLSDDKTVCDLIDSRKNIISYDKKIYLQQTNFLINLE